MSSLYQGAQVTADLKWDWVKLNPWFNYFTGFSSEHSKEMVHFKDLSSYAQDYFSNRIVEVYSGIPLSMIGFSTNDDDYYIKYMVKYGMEKGLGLVNDDHLTAVTELAVGMQAGELDFLAGVTQIGEDTFRGFETQYGHNAGGDMAMLNTFKYAGQKTLFCCRNTLSLTLWAINGGSCC